MGREAVLLQCANRFGQRRLDAGPFAPYIGIGVVADLIAVFVPEAEDRGVANMGGGVGCGGVHDLVVGEDRVAGLTSDLHRLVGQVDFGHALAKDFVPVLLEMIFEEGVRAGPDGEVAAVVAGQLREKHYGEAGEAAAILALGLAVETGADAVEMAARGAGVGDRGSGKAQGDLAGAGLEHIVLA